MSSLVLVLLYATGALSPDLGVVPLGAGPCEIRDVAPATHYALRHDAQGRLTSVREVRNGRETQRALLDWRGPRLVGIELTFDEVPEPTRYTVRWADGRPVALVRTRLGRSTTESITWAAPRHGAHESWRVILDARDRLERFESISSGGEATPTSVTWDTDLPVRVETSRRRYVLARDPRGRLTQQTCEAYLDADDRDRPVWGDCYDGPITYRHACAEPE